MVSKVDFSLREARTSWEMTVRDLEQEMHTMSLAESKGKAQAAGKLTAWCLTHEGGGATVQTEDLRVHHVPHRVRVSCPLGTLLWAARRGKCLLFPTTFTVGDKSTSTQA